MYNFFGFLFSVEMSYTYFETLASAAKERYLLKLSASGLTECPYKLPAGSWQNNPTRWPDLQWPDVFSYLIESPGILQVCYL